MSDRAIFDPQDGLRVNEVGAWSENDKHSRLRRYVGASGGARKGFLGEDKAGACYIDLYCGPGRLKIRDQNSYIDGSPLVAYKEARDSGYQFSSIHLADIDKVSLDVTESRLKCLGVKPEIYHGPAEQTVYEILNNINPYGLHVAFLDPYNLQALPFSVLKALASKLRRIDMLINVSTMDLQRSFNLYKDKKNSPLDSFAPGWREAVPSQIYPEYIVRREFLNYWLDLVRGLDLTVNNDSIETVTGNKNQNLYWLVFAARNKFAHELWEKIRDVSGQGKLDF